MDKMYVLSAQLAFEVAENDLPEKLEWLDAKAACLRIGDRWRLPTREELSEMYRLHEKAIGSFSLENYWSSTGTSNHVAFRINFANGRIYEGEHKKDNPPKYKVRPVRSI